MRIIDGPQVARLLDMPSCIDAMRRAFAAVSAGAVDQPIRTALHEPGHGLLGLMPGRMEASLGIKLVAIFPANFERGLPTHRGMVLLFDNRDGRPRAMLDAHAVTMIRTAAASAAATDLLARADADSLALLGYGDQAVSHLEAMRAVRPLRRVLVWGRHRDRAEQFAARHGVEVAGSVEQAVAECDIVCSLTAAPRPILYGRWLRPGQHVNAVGASLPHCAEIDGEAVARSRFFTDYRDSADALAGEWRDARAAGLVGADHLLGEIGDIILGKVAGRTGPDDITCFKSLGMAAEDLVAAELVLERAELGGVGTMVEF